MEGLNEPYLKIRTILLIRRWWNPTYARKVVIFVITILNKDGNNKILSHTTHYIIRVDQPWWLVSCGGIN